MPATVRNMLLIAKVIGFIVLSLIVLVILFFTLVIVRKSMPYVFSSDIERLASTGPYNSERMATEACGFAADLVGSADTESPLLGLPQGKLLSPSWRLLYPIEGAATVRITGVGFDRKTDRALGRCEATMRFRYRFMWSYNGRATVLESSFVDRPQITRP